MIDETAAPALERMRRRAADVNITSAAQLREYAAIADRIARDAPGFVLDWGCGHGQMADLMIRRGLRVDAFDYEGEGAPEAVVELERFPAVRAFLSARPVELPYENERFDAVLSCGVLEHVHDPDGSLEELKRVLKPGGTLYVYKLPNRFSYLERIARSLGFYYHGAARFDTIYTVRSAVALVRRHGFVVSEAGVANMLPLTLGGGLANRLADQIWAVNRALSRVPLLNTIATNVELVATVPR